MLKSLFHLACMAVCLVQPVNAQSYDQLTALKDQTARIYCSVGQEQQATVIAQRLAKAKAYYTAMLAFDPEVTLLVLNEPDWSRYTTMGAVYGMPHYNASSKTLFVACVDNSFWKSFLPPLDQLPQALREQVQAVYKNREGALSMQPFFDLLAIHELGHAFHNQGGVMMQRSWMGELFVNILLHTYIAEHEPALLPALTTFPRMVVAAGTRDFTYTSLKDIEERYAEIARNAPRNYGWYQCRWHAAAATIYDAGGKQVGAKLWKALQSKQEKLTDDQLVGLLASSVHKSVADMVLQWDTQTAKP